MGAYIQHLGCLNPLEELSLFFYNFHRENTELKLKITKLSPKIKIAVYAYKGWFYAYAKISQISYVYIYIVHKRYLSRYVFSLPLV